MDTILIVRWLVGKDEVLSINEKYWVGVFERRNPIQNECCDLI